MAIILATDHAGFNHKEAIKKYLKEQGHEVEDCGAFELDEKDDYPDFIIPAARKVAQDPEHNRGIILGGSGQGEAIAANKVKGIRAAVYYGGPTDIVKLSRQHNDANIIALGARFMTEQEAIESVRIWLDAGFDGGRHERRIKKISEIEN